MNTRALPDPKTLVPIVIDLCERSAEGREFTTYLVGVRGKKALKGIPVEEVATWKSDIKCAVGLAIGTTWERLGRRPEFVRPEMVMIYDMDHERVELVVRSIYVYGRYRKLDSDLPQTRARWGCPECNRKGCDVCQQTGRRYPTALEDLIGRPVAEAFGVTPPKGYQLHGMGREDVNVRCLGAGRPFVLEVKSPPRRTADLEALARRVEASAPGRVELPAPLRLVDVAVVARVKSFEADKVYRAVCEPLDGAVFDPADVATLDERLAQVDLEQRTPERVARRRADKIRRRQVRRFQTGDVTPERFVAEVTAQSGTYIKELFSGDGGRTRPSVADLLGVPCVCARLDVLDICATDEEVLASDPAPVKP